MANILSQASCFNPGADLWIVPDVEHSNRYTRINWLLNFQLSKAEMQISPKASPELQDIVEKVNLTIQTDFPTKHLLIPSHDLLPNRWLVIVPYGGDIKSWSENIYSIWLKLNKPSLRIFLPSRIESADFVSSWGQLESFQDYTLVLD